MRVLVFFLWLLVFPVRSFAQDPSISLKLTPLPLIDIFSFPTIQGGIELRVNEHFSLYGEYGYKYRQSPTNKADTPMIRNQGAKAKLECRYYLGKTRFKDKVAPLEGFYVATNVFYFFENYTNALSYRRGDSNFGGIKLLDNFAVKRRTMGLNVLVGQQVHFNSLFGIDFYAGVGFRYRQISTINKEIDPTKDTVIHPVDLTLTGAKNMADAEAKSVGMPNVTLGLRLILLIR